MVHLDLVSIIMPNYNGSRFISEAIDSVLSQTYPEWELIIVDDSSTDNSLEIIENYVKRDNRIKLLSTPGNSGAAVARNTGIEHAKGRYIAFLDSDDIWLPTKLEKQVKFMKQRNLAVTYSSYYVIDEKGNIKGLRRAKEKICYKDMLKSNWIGNLTGIYDSYKLGKVYMENVRHEDYTLWLKILKKVGCTEGLMEPLAKYRVLPNSYSSNKLKAITWMWNIYRNIEKLDILRSLFYTLHYMYYGIKKRL